MTVRERVLAAAAARGYDDRLHAGPEAPCPYRRRDYAGAWLLGASEADELLALQLSLAAWRPGDYEPLTPADRAEVYAGLGELDATSGEPAIVG